MLFNAREIETKSFALLASIEQPYGVALGLLMRSDLAVYRHVSKLCRLGVHAVYPNEIDNTRIAALTRFRHLWIKTGLAAIFNAFPEQHPPIKIAA